MLDIPPGLQGVLPAQWLRKALDAGVIRASGEPIPDAHVQPASLDLRLGEVAYRLRCSFLPEEQSVADKLADLSMEQIDLRDGAILERNRPYLIPLIEEIALPDHVRAKANPRSSTGRLDIFTRVITDQSHQFDSIAAGYAGRLYLEVVSRSFTVKVQTGISLNQLRLMTGRATYGDAELVEHHRRQPLLYAEGGAPLAEIAVSDGLFLSVDLTGAEDGRVGYRAKKNSRLLDLTSRDHEPGDFWEPLHAERGGRVVLEPEEFYLLVSSEQVRVPPLFAAEMAAYEPTSGELRTHYAGFFDPGFGYADGDALRGTKAVLEVRAHDVPFMLEHRQRICKLVYERMAEAPDVLYGAESGSSYQHQGLALSKHFRR